MALPSAPVERTIAFYTRGQPSLVLEGILHEPTRVERAPVIVLCHPQPASSDMHDALTANLARRLASAGVVALRFNFPGVGHSQGHKTDGRVGPLDFAELIDVV